MSLSAGACSFLDPPWSSLSATRLSPSVRDSAPSGGALLHAIATYLRRRPRTGNLPSTAVRGFSTTKISPSHHTCPGRRPRPLAHRLAPHVVSPISPHSSTRRSTGASRVRTRNDHRVSRSRRKLGVPCRSRLSRLSCRSSSRPDFPRAAATRHPHATRAGSRELERQTKQRRPFFGRRSEGFASRGAFGGHGVGRDAGTSHAPHPPPCAR